MMGHNRISSAWGIDEKAQRLPPYLLGKASDFPSRSRIIIRLSGICREVQGVSLPLSRTGFLQTVPLPPGGNLLIYSEKSRAASLSRLLYSISVLPWLASFFFPDALHRRDIKAVKNAR